MIPNPNPRTIKLFGSIGGKMEKKAILNALERLRKHSKKRNFNQTVDLIITLKEIDIKKPENQLDIFLELPNKKKGTKLCAFVGPELKEQAMKVFDKVITSEEIDTWRGKIKEQKSLAKEYDFFVAQANIMPKIAAIFGKVFGPRGKMPNPKAGCVVSPKANLEQLCSKLRKTVRLTTKKAPMIQCAVGKENDDDAAISENVLAVFNAVVHALPREKANIKKVFVKFTMSGPVEINIK